MMRPVARHPCPNPKRIVLAMLVSALVVSLVSLTAQESIAYALGTPILVGSGGMLWRQLATSPRAAHWLDTAVALLVLGPALAAREQAIVLAEWQLTVHAPHQMLDGVLAYCARATADTAPLLLSAAAGYLVLGGRAASPGLGVLLAAAAAAAGGSGALFAAREAAAAAEYSQVISLVRGVPWTGFLVLPGALLGVLFEGRRGRWSLARATWFLLAVGAGAMAGTTPLRDLMAHVEVPSTDVAVPTGELGPTTALAAVGGDPGELDAVFRQREQYFDPVQAWTCVTGPRGWAKTLRRSAAIALSGGAPVSELDEAADRFVIWTAHRLALVGRAEPMPGGPLAPLLGWPAVPLLLDPPPRDATAVFVGRQGVRVLGRPTPAGRGCALVPDDDATIDHVWQAGRSLLAPAGPCEGIALVPPVHRAALRADPEALLTLGCPPDRVEQAPVGAERP